VIPLVLASGSPRRRALLAALGVAFDVITSDAPEVDAGAVPAAIVEANARAKRDAVAARLTAPAAVIAADTLVFLEEQVLSKPVDRDDAIAMLQRLSGNTHQVVTGMALCNTQTGATIEGSETTNVTFRILSPAEIHRFVDTVNPLDRAGAYTVDGPGSLLVARYDGCYQNVLGLPIVRLDQLLRKIDIHLFDRIDPKQAQFL
jgi:septum formation protein